MDVTSKKSVLNKDRRALRHLSGGITELPPPKKIKMECKHNLFACVVICILFPKHWHPLLHEDG